MRIPLHPGGTREMLMLSLLLGIPGAVLVYAAVAWAWGWAWVPGVLLLALWAFGLLFFRDPERVVPGVPGIMVSPADGTTTEAIRQDHNDWVAGPATRISIFLSVFNVHVNRSPCAGVIRSTHYKPGKFLDARDPNSGSLNEANTIVIEPDEPGLGPVVVRQIAGLIARRVICTVKAGDHVERGQRIGLIKFGSRTELIIAGHDAYEPAVAVGDKVRGAMTVLARRMPLVGINAGPSLPPRSVGTQAEREKSQ
ncbi:MAG TPA: phosphatidylserine decarboxylase [Phycisphaerae bacterium]|nr:phosphatidylserine decarboxylase [Phycisphaerae bacterium]HRY67109.1 phosphatidylserine decarboxylase [Phycisphaerae bacterium]HSA26522.1 phosphatidylserine decarboxylase [Phycisphaerae bacterium]